MNLKNFVKYFTIAIISIFLSSSYISSTYASDHSPKWEKINELKKEITDLGGTPVKRKHLLSSLKKWTAELEAQLDKLQKIDAIKSEIKKELEALGEKPMSEETKALEADEEILALRKLLEEVKAKKKEAEEKKKEEAKKAEEKKKRDAKIAVAIEMLKDR